MKVWRKQKADPSRMAPGLMVGYEILHAPSYDKIRIKDRRFNRLRGGSGRSLRPRRAVSTAVSRRLQPLRPVPPGTLTGIFRAMRHANLVLRSRGTSRLKRLAGSLRRLYPARRWDGYPVASRCSDRTGTRARVAPGRPSRARQRRAGHPRRAARAPARWSTCRSCCSWRSADCWFGAGPGWMGPFHRG